MSKAWLRDLEEKVQEAAARLGELRRENAELREQQDQLESEKSRLEERVTELEAQLATAEEPGEGGAAEEAWRSERDEIRGRVEKLVEHLDTLLDDDDS